MDQLSRGVGDHGQGWNAAPGAPEDGAGEFPMGPGTPVGVFLQPYSAVQVQAWSGWGAGGTQFSFEKGLGYRYWKNEAS